MLKRTWVGELLPSSGVQSTNWGNLTAIKTLLEAAVHLSFMHRAEHL